MTEVELKLTPREEELLDRLAEVDRLGPFEVVGRRRERQRNSFFDTTSGGLRNARIGFRRRVIEGERQAVWTIKGESAWAKGVASRAEVELHLGADMPPALALQALRQRAPKPFSEQIGDALADGTLPLAEPYLEMATDRRIVDLRSERSQLELALDRVTMPGRDFSEVEIEVELKRGDQAELDEARRAIEALGEVHESVGSKLSRGIDYVERNARSSR
jgi:inorganic triphosphatase YgiF